MAPIEAEAIDLHADRVRALQDGNTDRADELRQQAVDKPGKTFDSCTE